MTFIAGCNWQKINEQKESGRGEPSRVVQHWLSVEGTCPSETLEVIKSGCNEAVSAFHLSRPSALCFMPERKRKRLTLVGNQQLVVARASMRSGTL